MLCVLSMVGASAQKYWDGARPNHRFTFGVRAGVNFAKQNNMEDGADNDFRTGFHVGLSADVNIVQSFSINTGVTYSQKGYKTEYADYRGSNDTEDNAAYVQIPLLASYRVALSDDAQFQINVGPYFAFGVAGDLKVKNTFENGESYTKDSFDEYDGTKKFDTGIAAGVALTYNHLYVGAGYERSLTNVSNTTEKFQNGCITLTLGYNF